jgi:PAS domain S-box-containing protein
MPAASALLDDTADVPADEHGLGADALQRAIFNSANFSKIATDARGVIQIFNVGAQRMLGYTAEEVLNKITPAQISDPQEIISRAEALSLEFETTIAPGFEALIFKASRGIEDIYELTYIRKDGSRFPAVVSVTALRDAGDAIIGYLLIGTDNTARKQIEAELRQSNQRIAIATESAGIGTWELDVLTNSITWDNGMYKLYGITRKVSESLYFVWANCMHPEDRIRRERELATAIRGETEFDMEFRIVRPDGEIRHLKAAARATRGGDGRVLRLTGVSLDITGRKRAEEALLKAGALQNAIFKSANFSSIATDARGVIQIFNVGAERMLGYTAEEVLNKITPAQISDPDEIIWRAQALSAELQTHISPGFDALVFKASRGIEDIYELTYIRKDGSRLPAVVSVTALRDADGAIIGYLLIGTDNTARKRAEAALLKAGALQNAIFNSANFSSIATDAKGVIQIFNVGAERMLGYTAEEVLNKITPAEISDPREIIARAEALSAELETAIAPGFDALVFKASRGIEDIYELTYIRKGRQPFPRGCFRHGVA